MSIMDNIIIAKKITRLSVQVQGNSEYCRSVAFSHLCNIVVLHDDQLITALPPGMHPAAARLAS